MKIRFLLDENLGTDIVHAVHRWDVSVDIIRVGSPGAPANGTLDPDILLYCERENRAIVTYN